MTVEEAKKTLAKNWWKNYPETFNHENFDIIIGDVITETLEDDFFPNCYIIKVKIIKKGEMEIDDDEDPGFAVFKDTGKCLPAVKLV